MDRLILMITAGLLVGIGVAASAHRLPRIATVAPISTPSPTPVCHDGGVWDDFDFGRDLGLAWFVEHSDAIVVGRFVEVRDGKPVTIATPIPTVEPDNFDLVLSLTATTIVVDEVLRSDGRVSVGDEIRYGLYGCTPKDPTAVAQDAAGDTPMMWDAGTEFVLFLSTVPGETMYALAHDECTRVLTTGSQVSCSDGSRTVRDFMAGLDREAFIKAVRAEIDHPSPTQTMRPTLTPIPTYTSCPTPCP